MKIVRIGTMLSAALFTTSAHADEYLIGVPQGLTGVVAYVGVPVSNGIKLAADDINASGMLGPNKIKVTVEDSASDKTQALAVVNRMARDPNILAILGPTSSGESLSVAPIANQLKVPLITTASAPDIPKAGPFAFKTIPNPGPKEVGSLAQFAVDKLNVQKCVLVRDRSGDGYVAQNNAFKDVLQATHRKIVSEESIVSTDTEFTGLATKLAAMDIDCLFLAMAPEPGAGIITQAKQSGMSNKVTVFIGEAAASPPWLELGGTAVEGSYLLSDLLPSGINDEGKKFDADYRKRFNAAPTNYAAAGYNSMKLLAWAIKNAGPNPTREKVRDEIAKAKDVPSILGDGTFSFGEDRIGEYKFVVLTVKGGKFQLVPN